MTNLRPGTKFAQPTSSKPSIHFNVKGHCMHRRQQFGVVVLGLVAALAFGGAARAGMIYSTGFEPPTYTVGTVAGQDSWQVVGPTNLTAVQTSVVKTGAQALGINSSGGVSGEGAFRDVSVGIGDGAVAVFSADQYFTSHASNGQAMVLYDSGLNVITEATLGSNGDVFFVNGAGFDDLGPLSLNAWHNWQITVNWLTQTASLAIDGTTLASNALLHTSDTQASIIGFQDSFPVGSDQRYVDNVSVGTPAATAVPEPATFTLLSIGAVGMLGYAWRRR
jgi:hypothetical protein